MTNGNRRARTGSRRDPSCYVRRPVTSRCIGLICAAFLLAACGGGQTQDAQEPSGKFKVQVTTASFPASQRLSEHTHLVLAVHNVSGHALPDVAVTICNVTCAYPAPAGEGTSAAAFAENLQMQGLAHASRPVWVLDNPPGPCDSGCSANSSTGGGGPGGAVTAYSNTWALGRLPRRPDGQVRLRGDGGQARPPRRRLGGVGRPERQGQGRPARTARSRTALSRC